MRYGGLEGKVTQIAADSNADPKGEPYFRVIVETEEELSRRRPDDVADHARHAATVDIQTGKRSVAFYMMKPVLKLKNEAFRERRRSRVGYFVLAI